MREQRRRSRRPDLLAEVHRGPTASVWQGRAEEGLVAVKILHPGRGRAERRRMLAQARRARAVGHPRLLTPLTVDSGRAGPITVWPWIEGRDLRSRLARHGLPAHHWGEAIADELDATVGELHGRGVAHGRLTADHVLLDREGRPVLVGVDPAAVGRDARHRDRRAAAAVRELVTEGPALADAPGELRRPGPPALVTRARPPGHRARRTVGVATVAVLVAVAARDRGPGDASCPTAAAPQPARRADVDGDGCEEALEWSTATGVLTAETATGPRAWRLGDPGDRLLLGDWDCDGTVTPGLRQRGSDVIHGFETWPDEGAARATRFDTAPACTPHQPRGNS